MLKRVVWWAAGAAMGAVGSQWAERKVRKTIAAQRDRYRPPAVAERMKGNAKDRTVTVLDGVRSAVDTGRRAAQDRESELREKYQASAPQRKR
jgi:hypothetical protein